MEKTALFTIQPKTYMAMGKSMKSVQLECREIDYQILCFIKRNRDHLRRSLKYQFLNEN